MIKVLLTAEGIDINATENTGVTPLIVAAWAGHTEVVEELVKAVCCNHEYMYSHRHRKRMSGS